MKKSISLIVCFFVTWFVFSGFTTKGQKTKPTICILGGTPSTTEILKMIPDSIKTGYHFISFNRPGFGGSKNDELTEKKLYKLAKKAGLKKNDFGIIGISGGAPLSILIAAKFNLRHCGIISGMVPKDEYFKFAEKAVTKEIMTGALGNYDDFETFANQFPNLGEIVKQAGASSKEIALRACYDEFRFVLSDRLFPSNKTYSSAIDWWHGEEDVNVPFQSAELFLTKFPNSKLNKIAGASHVIDANIYISKIINDWR